MAARKAELLRGTLDMLILKTVSWPHGKPK